MAMQEPRDLYDFTHQETSGVWMIVNDGVMGGISESRLSLDQQGFLVFEGRVSLDYGGGFASVRSILNRLDADPFDGILIRFKGDGKRYQLRLRQGDRMDGVAYFRHFETKIGEWEEVFLPFDSFQASYRGRRLPDYPKLDTSRISQLGLMISDKQEGNFRLEVQRIALYFNEHFQT
ncbi:MAG: CIA30 family protein [bacterium]